MWESASKPVYAHIIKVLDIRPMFGFVWQRLRYFQAGFTLDDATVAHLRIVVRALPPFAGLASLRFVTNGWLTARRLAHVAKRCEFGCHAMGGVCIMRYTGCPRFPHSRRPSDLPMPTSVHQAFVRDAFLLSCCPEDRLILDAFWRCLLYMVYTQSHAAARRWQARDVALALRTQVRALATRSARAVTLLGIGREAGFTEYVCPLCRV